MRIRRWSPARPDAGRTTSSASIDGRVFILPTIVVRARLIPGEAIPRVHDPPHSRTANSVMIPRFPSQLLQQYGDANPAVGTKTNLIALVNACAPLEKLRDPRRCAMAL